MKILLVSPLGPIRELPSVGLGYIGSVLSKNNIDVRICDTSYTGLDPIKTIETYNPDIVGITILSSMYREAIRVAKYAKKLNKTVVLGGAHISLVQEKMLENNFVDYCITGDGEYSLLKLVKNLEENISLEKIPGLIFKKETKVIKNPPEFIKDLDRLPFPNYKLTGAEKIKQYPIITSRGCPFQCIFCCVKKVTGSLWRSRSAKNVIEELIAAKNEYGATGFSVLDDNFTLDIKRAKKICELLISEKINMNWMCPNGVRADGMDEELISLMNESGCNRLMIGIESGNPEVFKGIKKGETLEQIENTVKLAKKYNFDIRGFFILGLPNSNFEKEFDSLKFAKRIGLDLASWSMAVPYPNTELMRWVCKNGTLLKDYKDFYTKSIEIEPRYETKDFPKDERMRAFVLMNLRMGSYWLALSDNKLKAGINLIKIILKYDPRNLHLYLADISKRIVVKIMDKIFGSSSVS